MQIFVACRPRQWTKNLLVFAAPLFALTVNADIWLAAFGSLVAFCMISSAIYLLNDNLDMESDRQHPRKLYRPIAAGQVSVPLALTTSVLLAVLSLTLAAAIPAPLAGVILSYELIQVGYCLRLKREPLLDLFCISAGFLLLAIAGGVAARLVLSPWFLLMFGLLPLFLAVEKRKAELQIALGPGVMTLQIFERYSQPVLLCLEGLVSISAFMSYSLLAAGPALNGASTSWMLLIVPFVLVGIYCYQLLSDPKEAERRRGSKPDRTSEKPEEFLLGDRAIKLTLLGWLITIAVVGALGLAS